MPMTRYVYRRVIKRGTINNSYIAIAEPTVEELYAPFSWKQEAKTLAGVALILFMAATSVILIQHVATNLDFSDGTHASAAEWKAYHNGTGPYPYEDNPEDDPLYDPIDEAKYGNEGK